MVGVFHFVFAFLRLDEAPEVWKIELFWLIFQQKSMETTYP